MPSFPLSGSMLGEEWLITVTTEANTLPQRKFTAEIVTPLDIFHLVSFGLSCNTHLKMMGTV